MAATKKAVATKGETGRKMKLQKERNAMIIAFAKKGRTINEIAYIFNLSDRRIGEILKENGVQGVRESAETAKQVKKTKTGM